MLPATFRRPSLSGAWRPAHGPAVAWTRDRARRPAPKPGILARPVCRLSQSWHAGLSHTLSRTVAVRCSQAPRTGAAGGEPPPQAGSKSVTACKRCRRLGGLERAFGITFWERASRRSPPASPLPWRLQGTDPCRRAGRTGAPARPRPWHGSTRHLEILNADRSLAISLNTFFRASPLGAK